MIWQSALWFESSCYPRAIGTIDNDAMLFQVPGCSSQPKLTLERLSDLLYLGLI